MIQPADRDVFRICHARYLELAGENPYKSKVAWSHVTPRSRALARPRQDYLCDFELVGRRLLGRTDYALFRGRFLEGLELRELAGLLYLTPGQVGARTVAIEGRLGRAFREMEPYPLFPLDAYFGRR